VAWSGTIRVLEEFGPIELEGLELGRTNIVARGNWCATRGRGITIELYLRGQRVQVLASVAEAAYVGGIVVLRLDLEASSPRGNDLLAATVRDAFNDVETSPDVAA
jgi:hypothetical protein